MNKSDFGETATTLDEIIKELPQYKKKQQDSIEKQVIIVDKDSGEILDELPVFNFFKKFRFFELNRKKVAFNISGPQLSISYSNSPYPFKLNVVYDAKINDKGVFNLIRAVYNSVSPIESINNIIRESISGYVFEHKDFVNEFNKYRPEVEDMIKKTGSRVGLEIRPTLVPNINRSGEKPAESFVNCEHKVITKTRDAQTVEIVHDLALTLIDPIKFSLSRIDDIKIWAKNKLEQYTNNAIIEMNYAEVLVNLKESVIRHPMFEACRTIGYELKQLITVPGLEIEKFYFETVDNGPISNAEFWMKDACLKISLNIIVDGRLDLHNSKTKTFIKPGLDIISGMKKNVIEYARVYVNAKTPDECFIQQYEFEDNLVKLIRTKLGNSYGFKELGITIKFLETDLSRRLSLLQEKPGKVEILADWTERTYILWFRVMSISNEGWFRFRTNNYKNSEDELNDIGRMVKNGMESFVLRNAGEITGKAISNEFSKIQARIRIEFGLDVRIHDFKEDLSKGEKAFVEGRNVEFDEQVTRTKLISQGKTAELNELLKKREQAIIYGFEDEVKEIDKKIADIQNMSDNPKSLFLKQKTDNNFLLPPGFIQNERTNSENDDSDKK